MAVDEKSVDTIAAKLASALGATSAVFVKNGVYVFQRFVFKYAAGNRASCFQVYVGFSVVP